MSRYSHPLQTPGSASARAAAAQPTFEGDQQFIGLDMETAPWLLPTGHYSRGQNARCATGSLGKRKGTIKPGPLNLNGFPGGILGADVFNNPNSDTKVMLVATPATVWQAADGAIPTEIGLPDGVTLAGDINFTQHFDKVTLHQSDGRPTYEWDGNPAHKFAALAQIYPTTNNVLVPPAAWSVPYGPRSLFPVDRDRFGVSDAEDYGSWDKTTRNYRANTGTADIMTGLFPYLTGNLLIGKRQSLDVFKNFRGDLSQLSAEVVSSTLGVWARKSWQLVGADALFLAGPQGVFRLNQVDQNRLQASPIPVAATRDDNGRVTDPIAPLLRRVNWPYADRAVAGLDGPYYALAVPIDGATRPNCILWLNTVSEKWEGYDVYDPRGQMQIDELLVFDYLGDRRLYAVNRRSGTIHLLNEGVEDELKGGPPTPGYGAPGRYEIDMDVETRSYATLGWNAAVKRDFKRVVIPVRTSRPSITLEEIPDGANDFRQLTKTTITRDRRKYDTFGKKNYDVTNVNDDFHVPGRQDYSVVLSGAEELHLGANGVTLGQKQESVLGGPGGFSTKCRGRSIRYRIRCTAGECDVLGVLVESNGVQREVRQAA